MSSGFHLGSRFVSQADCFSQANDEHNETETETSMIELPGRSTSSIMKTDCYMENIDIVQVKVKLIKYWLNAVILLL